MKVVRTIYEKEGKQYFAYFVKGILRGKEVRASVVPTDVGGYTLLDIVFADSNEAELINTPFEFKDEASGNVISGNSFTVRSVDENGEIYECKVKPNKSSDKSLLNMLMK